MMTWDTWTGVLCVPDRVQHKLANVVVLYPVIDGRPLAARRDQPSQPQLRQVLRDSSRLLRDRCSQLANRQFTIKKTPQQPDPGPVGQHPKHLHRQVDLIVFRKRNPTICIHTQIMTRASRRLVHEAWHDARITATDPEN
jgi:hypothetical protein